MFINVSAMIFLWIQEWVSKQEALKQEPIEITYSYWDGSGHRKTVRMKKGTIHCQFR